MASKPSDFPPFLIFNNFWKNVIKTPNVKLIFLKASIYYVTFYRWIDFQCVQGLRKFPAFSTATKNPPYLSSNVSPSVE